MEAQVYGRREGETIRVFLVIYNPQTRKRVYKSTGYSIPVNGWNANMRIVKRSVPNGDLINSDIARQKNELQKSLLSVKSESGITQNKIKSIVKNKDGANDFLLYFKDHVNEIEKKKAHNYWKQVNTLYNDFTNFTNGHCEFKDINVQLMRGFENYLWDRKDDKGTRLNNTNTIAVKFNRLRHVIKKANIDLLIPVDAINGYKAPGYVNPERPYLTADELQSILKDLLDGKFEDDKNLALIVPFFLVECLCGIRFSDWKRFKVEKAVNEESIKVRAKKTGEDIYYPLRKAEKLRSVIKHIRDNNLEFNFTEQQTNRQLKRLGDIYKLSFDLTTHVGRHTCATLHLEMGYSESAVAEILGVSVRTVSIYAKVTRRKLTLEYDKFGGI